MLNFRNALMGFTIVLAALLLADVFIRISPWFYPGIVLVMISLLTWGSMNVSSGFYMKMLCRGSLEVRSVALSFDDGPDAAFTPGILDVLNENCVQAAFFVVGSRADENPGLVTRIQREGHILAGHSHTHGFFFDLLSLNRMKQELTFTEGSILRITGKRIRLFRPPYGVTNPTVAKAVSSMRYTGIGWSLKSKDTVKQEEDALLRRLIKRVRPGDIVLFHDNRAITGKVLGAFIDHLRQHHYSVERLDHFLQIEAYAD